jgi:hypothetical protein
MSHSLSWTGVTPRLMARVRLVKSTSEWCLQHMGDQGKWWTKYNGKEILGAICCKDTEEAKTGDIKIN